MTYFLNPEKMTMKIISSASHMLSINPTLKKISKQLLLECKGNFSLLVYFNSYIEIKRDNISENTGIENFYSCYQKKLRLTKFLHKKGDCK
jgi:hypothetical protein